MSPLHEVKKMTIKCGSVVSHTGAHEWGSGKVMEMSPVRATIQFSDGIIRKIASSHYGILQPADPASYLSPPDAVPAVKVRAAVKRAKKPKPPIAA